MFSVLKKNPAFTAFIAAVILYFYSESVLRIVSLSTMDIKGVKIESIISKLPINIRSAVTKKIEIAELKDAVTRAKDDKSKVLALINLAFVLNGSEQEKIYINVIKDYPPYPEAVFAYKCFFLKNDPRVTMDIETYQSYISKCPELSRPGLWMQGIAVMKTQNTDPQIQFNFLKPLLEYEPKFRDYEKIYEYLIDISMKLQDDKYIEIASRKAEECVDLPYCFYEEMIKMAKQKPQQGKNSKK